MKRFRVLAALLPLLGTAACQNRNGSTDWGETLLLGAGVGTAAALLGGAFNDVGNSQRAYRPRPYHGGGTGYLPPVAGPAYGGHGGFYNPNGYTGRLPGGGWGSGYAPAYRGWGF